jgi:hypothetical protein
MALFVSHRFRLRGASNQPVSRGTMFVVTTYWLMIGLSLAIMVTALLQMLPLLGTREIARAIDIHRYCGLALLPIALIHPVLLKMCRR